MKIRLTENQYKKLFEEGVESSSIGNTITPKVLKFMRSLNKVYNGSDNTIKELTNNWGLNNSDATTIVHNYEQIFKNLPDEEYESFLGKPLEFQGTYVINVSLPTIVAARAYLDYEITIKAGSSEEALENAATMIRDPSFNDIEIPETNYNMDPDLDWDFNETELLRDMSYDVLRDFYMDWQPEEMNKHVTLKK